MLLELIIILIAAKVAGNLSLRFGQPSVLGQLIAGIIIGPSLLGWVHNTEVLKELSSLGVILLMFIAGMETNLQEFKASAKASTYVGLSGIIVPLVGGYFSALLMGLTQFESALFGLVLSATSVSISVQTLRELDRLKTKEGMAILGAAVLDDIVVIVLLAFTMSILGGDVSITTVLLKMLVFFVVGIFAAWKLVPWILRKFSHTNIPQGMTVLAVIICLAFAYFAEETGISDIIGAYLAGIAISRTEFQEKIMERVEVLSYSLFVPIFFISIGLSTEIGGLDSLWLILPFGVLAIMSKWIGGGLGAKLAGFSWSSSSRVGAGMISRGEVALILASLGLERGFFSPALFSILVMVVLITTIVTPPILKILFQDKKKFAQ
ncbi:cation:proton antiporter [Brevibacillus sp. B_LB10_24]|uniref:cation:proton antiporter n=1 Tax=Brevibacillus sp. B_LB10_24 TaxID=3380645 RepID=UPI0038BCFE77